jgi:alkaline phosphatase D
VAAAAVAIATGCGRTVTLTQAPTVGAVTPTTAAIFVRTSKPAEVAIRIDGRTVARARSDQRHDNIAHLPVLGLRPETPYRYRVVVNGSATPTVYTFRTFAAADESRSFKFVAISDQHNFAPAPVFKRLAEESPTFVIQLGDFRHYKVADEIRSPTVRDWWLNDRKAVSALTAGGRDFSRWIAPALPFVHIWDDHDYGTGNGDRTFRYRTAATRAFLDYFPVYPRSSENGLWQRFSYAEAEFFVLDLRSQRDPDKQPDGPTKSMLGVEQKAWFLKTLADSSARWKFVVSSSVWNPHSKRVDSWHQFATEQGEIIHFIKRKHITGVIFISGDLHSNGGIDNGANSTFPEISVPHTNLTSRACTGRICGRWSEGISATSTEGGYVLFTVTPAYVKTEIKGASGAVRRHLVIT